ncbi:hypothetical protein D3C75_853620 [compost metagenome]
MPLHAVEPAGGAAFPAASLATAIGGLLPPPVAEAAAGTLLPRLHIHHLKIDGMIAHIHPRHPHLHLVADAEHTGGAFAYQGVQLLMEVIIIVGQVTEPD